MSFENQWLLTVEESRRNQNHIEESRRICSATQRLSLGDLQFSSNLDLPNSILNLNSISLQCQRYQKLGYHFSRFANKTGCASRRARHFDRHPWTDIAHLVFPRHLIRPPHHPASISNITIGPPFRSKKSALCLVGYLAAGEHRQIGAFAFASYSSCELYQKIVESTQLSQQCRPFEIAEQVVWNAVQTRRSGANPTVHI